MSYSDVFERLLIGLSQRSIETKLGSDFGLPQVLQQCLNELALGMGSKYPKTLNGLFKLMSNTGLENWYPFQLPEDFDPQACLLEGYRLSYESIEYLDKLAEESDSDLTKLDTLGGSKIVLQNRRFRLLRQRLKDLYITEPEKAQNSYVQLRRFLIENPYTTLLGLENVFFNSESVIKIDEVAALYEESTHLRLKNADGTVSCWNCPHCGPLYIKNGDLTSIKSSVCGLHCPGRQGKWQQQSYEKGLLVLTEGIHLRTHIPGIAELDLYDWLCNLYEDNHDYMALPELWPGIDAYDIRIEFKDEVWAVDVKDFKDPFQLGKQLQGIDNKGHLRWSRAFYVYPAYREGQRKHYWDIAHRISKDSRKGAALDRDDSFRDSVETKLTELKKRKK